MAKGRLTRLVGRVRFYSPVLGYGFVTVLNSERDHHFGADVVDRSGFVPERRELVTATFHERGTRRRIVLLRKGILVETLRTHTRW